MFFKLLIISVVLPGLETIPLTSLYCINPRNSPCYYGCARGLKCGKTGYSFKSFSDEERLAVLSLHNELRNAVAGGYYANHLSHARNMQVLSYDKEAEFLAACYIKQCEFRHDSVRKSFDLSDLGQNIFTTPKRGRFEMDVTFIKSVVNDWFEQIYLLNPKNTRMFYTNFKYIKKPNLTTDVTQIVWGDTKFIGCAKMVSVKEAGWLSYDMYCNYKPKGNIDGGRIYSQHQACAKYNENYEHLCGFIRPLNNDTYVPPYDLDKMERIEPLSAPILILFALLIFIIKQWINE